MPTLATNKRARFDYDLLEEFEGGLVLTGAEVKSAKKGNMSLQGTYISLRDKGVWLRNAHIGAYAPAGEQEEYNPTRDRKVLVHKSEIKKMLGKKSSEGLTIVPIRVYTKGALVKLSFALARGKRKHEKRDAIKKRDIEKQSREEMKKTRFKA
ncbi:MAG: SsrA RNA (tmRNA)-binding protein [uncultured bacterium]|uniref:SsrA-binding protein n=1 Tax=Candidatus Uhrbacteria bacterium GW2011_GWC1_41_20 TaxID=1618983 RepID=A0A0G0VHW9_9BACT|nr:MAG: SsrA RNA (tmRNA)-binding protein [uncultured bacterium]KKR22591.1 MAG: SsrA-binding protein [Candidatus Uhrbacteria bacterium GW2011_GWE1_39_46]KKR63939.1 MAG: SsrA-binding protein [Candidatus Uhrbacteria bacterium GW2011_GWC2_40_450]KKR90149.1 MAG: SsrA-binding protein [Candidatus Uhrbacteria bacterium GW2011_GWD2_41_121]KKR94309.1 MAG: SsrA-binding protein [Candidatus Uhrbacteria bacterium GW2011_GWD1_41_16]KKR99231.1 MAG: SsrA RNA (tmRNA)-binding protein, SsrA-binding protein [Candi